MDWSFRLHCISFSLAITGPGLLVNSALAQRADRFAGTREAMVEQFIVAEGIDNERVLVAMRSVPRHEFVRRSLQNLAYFDQALDIGQGSGIAAEDAMVAKKPQIPRPRTAVFGNSGRVVRVGETFERIL